MWEYKRESKNLCFCHFKEKDFLKEHYIHFLSNNKIEKKNTEFINIRHKSCPLSIRNVLKHISKSNGSDNYHSKHDK